MDIIAIVIKTIIYFFKCHICSGPVVRTSALPVFTISTNKSTN